MSSHTCQGNCIAHPLLALVPQAERLIPALTSAELLESAWQDHSFRDPLGTIGRSRNPLLHTCLIDQISAIMPMLGAAAMRALLERRAR